MTGEAQEEGRPLPPPLKPELSSEFGVASWLAKKTRRRRRGDSAEHEVCYGQGKQGHSTDSLIHASLGSESARESIGSRPIPALDSSLEVTLQQMRCNHAASETDTQSTLVSITLLLSNAPAPGWQTPGWSEPRRCQFWAPPIQVAWAAKRLYCTAVSCLDQGEAAGQRTTLLQYASLSLSVDLFRLSRLACLGTFSFLGPTDAGDCAFALLMCLRGGRPLPTWASLQGPLAARLRQASQDDQLTLQLQTRPVAPTLQLLPASSTLLCSTVKADNSHSRSLIPYTAIVVIQYMSVYQ